MTEVIIREVDTASEGATLRELMARAYDEYLLVPFHRPVESVSDCWLVATVDDSIVGYAVIQVARGQEDADNISEVFVAPDYRRRGVGTALIKALLDESTSGFVASYASPADAATNAFLLACGLETREPRGILLEGDRQAFWHIGHELRAAWLRDRAAEQRRLSHATAVALHGLTDLIPRSLYLNVEQSPTFLASKIAASVDRFSFVVRLMLFSTII